MDVRAPQVDGTGEARPAGPLPPGQRAVGGFPRFGTHLHRPPPPVPVDPVIGISGAVQRCTAIPIAGLRRFPRRSMTADLHCVSGWSATGLRWEGVPFDEFYRTVIEPLLLPDAVVTHLGFCGLDGYRAVVHLEDALAPDVLVADRLDGQPLDGDHGAPARLVSPGQYGYMSAKHLCRIEVHTSAPQETYAHATWLVRFGLRRLAVPHPRARVWEQERHPRLPAHVVLPVYRRLIAPIRMLSARGSVRRT